MLKSDEKLINEKKRLLKKGKKNLGMWLQLGSSAAAEALASTGIDWLFIDMEHGPSDLPGLIQQLQAIKGYGTVPIVRAPGNDTLAIKKILDAGAYGIHIPYIFDKADVEAAVAACKYPPAGCRGVSSTGRASGYSINPRNYLDAANDEIYVMVAVETQKSAENVEDILSVEGLDGIFIGPMDLATDMGHFANPKAPEVQETIRRVEQAVIKSGKVLAGTCGDFSTAKAMFDRGYSLVFAGSDVAALGSCALKLTADFAAAYPER